MKIHTCKPQTCGTTGRRIYIFTARWSVIIGTPSQVWLPKIGYIDRFFWVAIRPRVTTR